MRTPYSSPAAAPVQPHKARAAAQTVIQLGTLAYWLPCLCVDFYVLWGWRDQAIGYSFVFHALLREAVVFLVLWGLVGGATAMLFSRSTETRRRRRPGSQRPRQRPAKLEVSAMSRDHRGA